jgi:hypothetical protein
VLRGELETCERPATSARGLAATARGVDMEAFAVFASAARHGVPALAVKAVSDVLPEQPGPQELLRWLLAWPVSLRRAISSLDYLGERLCVIAAGFPARAVRPAEPLCER